ncbi:MAG TPA: sensor domain-containing diguanylate cyclase [Spirochaetales bacterium]|nr:sensor domain-containing diguanylate cyclase [Spirochaetales bacterium]
MHKKKVRTMVFLSFFVVGCFVATSYATYQVALQGVWKQITTTDLPLTSDNIYSEIQKDLLMPMFISSLMANDTFVRDWILHGEKDTQAMVRYLKQIKDRYKTFTSFFVSDRTKIYYHAEGILKTVSEYEPRDVWFFRVREMEPEFEINVDPDMANNDTMTIFVNYKVFDYNHKFIGATGVGLSVSFVKALIAKYQNQYNREIYFTDKEGKIVLYNAGTFIEGMFLKNVPGIGNYADAILNNEFYQFSYNFDNKKYFTNTRYIPELGWYLIVNQSDTVSVSKLKIILYIDILLSLLIAGIALFVSIRVLNTYQSRIEHLAQIDTLTGIANRQTFQETIEIALEHAKISQKPLSFAILDIDDFKDVNDTYGHLAGDYILVELTKRIQGVIRSGDFFARWGGEEFVVIFNDCSVNTAFEIADRIRQVAINNSIVYEKQAIVITLSIGLTSFSQHDSSIEIIKRADKALYSAKTHGKNSVCKL